MRLTAKQQRFVDEYLKDLNATRAAIRAGYSKKTATEIASENLTKPHIQEAVADAQAAIAERNEVTVDRIVGRYQEIAFADVPTSPTVRDQIAALDSLSKHLGMSSGNLKIDLKGEITVADVVSPDADEWAEIAKGIADVEASGDESATPDDPQAV